VTSLEEAIEAGRWVEERVLSVGALGWYLHALERQLGPDHGLGDSQLRKELTALLRSGVSAHSRERRRLTQMLPMVTAGYLQEAFPAATHFVLVHPGRLGVDARQGQGWEIRS